MQNRRVREREREREREGERGRETDRVDHREYPSRQRVHAEVAAGRPDLDCEAKATRRGAQKRDGRISGLRDKRSCGQVRAL